MFSCIFTFSLLATQAAAYFLPEDLPSVKTCTVPKNTPSQVDDTPIIKATTAECGDTSRVIFQAGVTYNLMTPLELKGLNNIELVFNGNLTLPDNLTYVESVVGNPTMYPGHWITIKGTNVTLTGSNDPSDGWFIGHGELWWSAGESDSDNDYRPHFFSLGVTNLRARELKVWKPVAWVFSLGGSNVWMTDTLVDAKSNDGFPFNTDGIDMSASNSLIDGFTIYSGDDMINISPPTTNVTVRNIYTSGGHGVSVSCSSGTGGDYLFENAIVENSLMGARFKGSLGTTCQLYNVMWRNFTIHNTGYPIHFIENYVDQEKGIGPGVNTSLAAYGTNFTWEDIKGQTGKSLNDGSCISDPCWSATLGGNNSKALYLLCKDAAHCQNFHFSGINLLGYDGEPGVMECTGLEGDKTMGVACTNGTISLN
ncbi:glycoside hydrolase family 28 protein [Pseudomassariella vexata]|uniref:Glycoside hydrolase family 28 protein n=1 Tax=Pseudomassariella vexata TaxID=1141098 RepID=A0A1Y2E6K4_9PEZI|nr:glycoside hydrolase family 28 protein [Pseudomassariella vexata]ORY67181.1 glycoside hydrolase family 28 protein [Pseudomassariella vexata]